ncbi:gag protease polyprotein [Cucumis melo var. makuwa]|uniref:Gag protease polyprotein n=1 Tax=Cucumis melo var. makuwa TaxID=1194695 RepID=A0A5D3BJ10_CUCMM|nr:gag protease polyprotein [Cucumis melo var. makuwa]
MSQNDLLPLVREVGCIQPGGQPTVQATNPATPITHANLAAMEYRECLLQQDQGAGAPQQDKVFATNKPEADRASTIVIGMNWLVANHTSIDCSRKKVVFNPPTGTNFNFEGVGTVVLPKVIIVMKVSQQLNQELPGLPPHTKIDFTIKLEPGIVPISRVSYRMASAKLKELKVQLQELLDKGFI